MSELFRRLLTGKSEIKIIDLPQDDHAIRLGDKRLGISSHLGVTFTQLLEREGAIYVGLPLSQLEIINRAYDTLSSSFANKRRGVLDIRFIPEGEIVTAYLLRVAKPQMIIGHQLKPGEGIESILSSLAFQLGLPERTANRQAISDRLEGREQVAVVLLDINFLDPASIRRLLGELKGIPPQGALILSS